MEVVDSFRFKRLFLKIGGLALVAYLLVFEQQFGLVAEAPVDGLVQDILAGGLLVIAILGFVAFFTISVLD